MSQIKDPAPATLAGLPSSLRSSEAGAIDGQIAGLLTRRARLVEDLATIEAKLAELRGRLLGAVAPADEEKATRRLPIRGEELRAGGYDLPAEADARDVRQRLDDLLLAERQDGRPLDGLEILLEYRLDGGRVRSVCTRRSGDVDWVSRFEDDPR